MLERANDTRTRADRWMDQNPVDIQPSPLSREGRVCSAGASARPEAGEHVPEVGAEAGEPRAEFEAPRRFIARRAAAACWCMSIENCVASSAPSSARRGMADWAGGGGGDAPNSRAEKGGGAEGSPCPCSDRCSNAVWMGWWWKEPLRREGLRRGGPRREAGKNPVGGTLVPCRSSDLRGNCVPGNASLATSSWSCLKDRIRGGRMEMLEEILEEGVVGSICDLFVFEGWE